MKAQGKFGGRRKEKGGQKGKYKNDTPIATNPLSNQTIKTTQQVFAVVMAKVSKHTSR